MFDKNFVSHLENKIIVSNDPFPNAIIKDLMPKTPLQMLLRGQSLVGYRAYSDDVVDQFISSAASTGIDIFRVFDALNDKKFNLAIFIDLKKAFIDLPSTPFVL